MDRINARRKLVDTLKVFIKHRWALDLWKTQFYMNEHPLISRLGTSTGKIYALRGFLVEYRLVGCTLPPAVQGASPASSNKTHAM